MLLGLSFTLTCRLIGRQTPADPRGDTDDAPPEFALRSDGPLVPLQLVTAKRWYRLLVRSACQQFPGRNIADIWESIDLKYSCHSVFNSEFKIRHRWVFTGVVLRQIDMTVYSRTCSVCGVLDETLEHLVLHCPVRWAFWDSVCGLLRRCCGWSAATEMDLLRTLLFGLPRGSKTNCEWTVNLVLAFAHYTFFQSRNFALNERKKVGAWLLFKKCLKFHLRMLWIGIPEWVKD